MAEAPSHLTLGEFLVREGMISQSQLNQALAEQRSSSRSIGRILVDSGLISESMRMNVLQKRFGFELIRLKDQQIDPIILGFIPYSFAEKHHVVPVRQEGNRVLWVAMEDPSDLLIIDAIKNQVSMPVRPCIASQEDIMSVLSQYATGVEEAARAKAARHEARHSFLYRALKTAAFPILAIAPLAAFFVELAFDDDFQRWLHRWLVDNNWGQWDLAVTLVLLWALWTVILFEFNGLIFGEKPPSEEEE